MRVYTVYLSEDGLVKKCFTNAKVLFDFVKDVYEDPQKITFCNSDKSGTDYGTFVHEELKFNYSNILKAIKLSEGKKQEFLVHFTIKCKYGSSIDIQELNIVSK